MTKYINMKKIFYYNIILLVLVSSISCTKDFDKINTNPNNITQVSPDQLLPSALVSSFTYNLLRNRNFNNELMQVTVSPSDADGTVFRYDFRSTWADYLWNGLFVELNNFKDMYNNKESNNKSYKGISLICQVWLFSILTDTYGDIPFSQASSAKNELGHIMEPVFDRQKDVYLGMFKMLEEANTLLAANEPIIVKSDPVYNGNISGWRKLGNSMYLRLLLRVSGKSEVADQCKAKIKEIAETNQSNYPTFNAVQDAAILRWTGTAPYISPLSINVREQDFRMPGLATFFIRNLTDWNDPRIDINTYGKSGVNRWGIAQGPGGFAGINSGYNPGEPANKQSYFYSNTTPANNLQTDPMTGQIMNYAELNFILAEAALKGWISGSAENYYNKGAEASIKLWLPDWPKQGENIVTWLTNADIQWFNSYSSDEKMELIHKQKYYALFCNDLQQWFEYRRTGHPVLPKGPGLRNGGVMPARMTYPIYVQSTNPTNYKQAVQAQGNDVISTQVWWQKP
jgi:hypothetical protein